MNIISIVSLIVWYLVVIVGDIVGLVFIKWTSQLPITIVETLVLSVVAIIWTLY